MSDPQPTRCKPMVDRRSRTGPPQNIMPRPHSYRLILIVVLAVGIVLNISQFPQIERSAGPYHRALEAPQGGGITEIASNHM